GVCPAFWCFRVAVVFWGFLQKLNSKFVSEASAEKALDRGESMRLRTFTIVAAALLILASGAAVWSQTVQGVITGTITDPTGAVAERAVAALAYKGDRTTIQEAGSVDRVVFEVLPFRAPRVSPGRDMIATAGGGREAGTSYMLNSAKDNNNFSDAAININPPL